MARVREDCGPDVLVPSFIPLLFLVFTRGEGKREKGKGRRGEEEKKRKKGGGKTHRI